MPKGVVATMDTVGFIQEPGIKIDRAIAYWFANRIDQCIILRNVKSYQYVVAKHQDDKKGEERFLEDIQKNLREYLLQIFDAVSVNAWAKREQEGDKMFSLILSGIVEQDGKKYDLAHAVSVNGETYKLIDIGRGLR
ncbi:putative virion structural protein [Pseudomonas phage OBP]|uniref:putative virion structural protein n=1 Tax=Pseudomonas phage OBP TaxID=1124849 RepID=UPI000240D41D|nr:putative virion structural protein [Pseudomonas phage OBP]AEV89500.1 putative virion structural protein [Pseudomonas phage OBP]